MHSSAIIPVRNRASLVSRSIASIQLQTHPLDEIIVIDDGSSDGTPDVVTRLSRDDSRIRLVALAVGQGASTARNVGINLSQGDWICFLDSDDAWLPEKHDLQSRALTKNRSAIACFTGIRYQHRDHDDDVDAFDPSPAALRRGNNLGSISTAMVRRDILRMLGGFDPELESCQDWDLYIRLRAIGEFAIVQKPLVLYNAIEQVRISNSKQDVLSGHSKVFKKVIREISDKIERRELSAHHQRKRTELLLFHFYEPIIAAGAAVKLLLFYRAGARLFLLACRHAIKKTLRRLISYL